VLTELVRGVAGVQVVQRGISTEAIAIAVPTPDEELRDRINATQADLEADGTLSEIRDRWLGSPWLDQSYP
jgi:ABC-type amino acid transport substrate-binding protein